MKRLFVYLLICPLLALWACSGDSSNSGKTDGGNPVSDEVAAPTLKEPVAPKTMDRAGTASKTNYDRLHPMVAEDVKALEKKYDMAPYFFEIDGQRMYYVVNGKWEVDYERNFKRSGAKLGIVDANHEEILPVAYDKIYNPDGTAKGFIEIEAEGKKGLYGYKNKVTIPCSFDLLFPSDNADAIAVGKQGDGYFFLHEDGHTTGITSGKDIPRYVDMGKQIKFDFFDKGIPELYQCYDEYFSKGDKYPVGMKFLPSYLHELGFIPETMGIGGDDMGNVTDANGEVESVDEVGGGISAFITSFYEEGVSARDYQYEKNHLVTLDDKNNVYQTIELGAIYPGGSAYLCGEEQFQYRWAGEGLLETVEVTQAAGGPHSDMARYRYYEIGSSGEINEKKSDRFFACTQFVKMEESYLATCWTEYVEPMSGEWDGAEGDGNMLVGDHLTIEDLDVMRNEIYASYGYKFKKAKWQDYFGNQKWYKPRFDNVEDQMTEIDRYNVDLILKVKKKMQDNPGNYPEPTREWYVAAG